MAQGIAPAKNKERLCFKDGRTVDIQKVIFEVNRDGIFKETAELSRQFKPTKAGLNDLWRFVKYRIQYREDPDGVQYVKYPARLWADRVGDCKSFTLFIVSVLQNLGIRYTIRFTSYKKGSRTVTHVYPVAHLDNGETVIVDAVWYYFNSQKSYAYVEDYKFGKKKMAAIYKLSGVEDEETRHGQRSLAHTLSACVGSTQAIPDSILHNNDVTKMTEAEFYRFLGFSKVSGINAAFETNRAFMAPSFNFDTASVHGFDTEGVIGKLMKKKAAGKAVNPTGPKPPMVQPVLTSAPAAKKKAVVKKVLDAAGEALKKAWAKLTNFLFKGALQTASPFFLFTFLKKSVSPAIAAKVKAQNKILDFICKVAKIDRAKVDAALRQGIAQKYGKQPEQILNDTAKASVAGIGVLPVAMVVAAIPKIIEIVKKIATFFKKSTKDVPLADAKTASDLEVLAKEAGATGVTKPAGEAADTGKVIVQPSEAKSPVVNPTAEQRDAESASQQPQAASNGGGASSAATAESEGTTEGAASNDDPKPAGSSGSTKGKGNSMLYAGIAAAVVLVMVMK
jgi:hypothetical protein